MPSPFSIAFVRASTNLLHVMNFSKLFHLSTLNICIDASPLSGITRPVFVSSVSVILTRFCLLDSWCSFTSSSKFATQLESVAIIAGPWNLVAYLQYCCCCFSLTSSFEQCMYHPVIVKLFTCLSLYLHPSIAISTWVTRPSVSVFSSPGPKPCVTEMIFIPVLTAIICPYLAVPSCA